MKLETKYDIGDIVEFVREQKTTGGDKIPHTPEVGIIEKILFDGKTVNYLMKSSYQAWVQESWIKHKLEKSK